MVGMGSASTMQVAALLFLLAAVPRTENVSLLVTIPFRLSGSGSAVARGTEPHSNKTCGGMVLETRLARKETVTYDKSSVVTFPTIILIPYLFMFEYG